MGIKILNLRHREAPLPGGCRWCGVPYRGHGVRWVPGHPRHAFTAPTQAQRAARMQDRRTGLAPRIITNLASDDRTRL